MEQTLQPVRSQDTTKVADGHDGCHDTEKGQGRERAEEDWEVKTERDIDLDPRIKVALLTAMLPADYVFPVVGWEVHV